MSTDRRPTVRIAVLTDMHVSPVGTADGRWNNEVRLSQSHELLATAIAEAAAERVDHVLVLGDAADQGDDVSEADALAACTEAEVPVWAVPGNHDVAADAEALIRAAGRIARGHALDAQVHDLADGVGICGVRILSADGGGTCTAIGLPAQLDPRPSLLVLATHYPVLSVKPRLRARGLRYPGDLINRRDVQKVAESRTGPTVVLHGHVHAPVALVHMHLLQIGCAPLAEWPHAWTLVEIDRERRSVELTRRPVVAPTSPQVDTTFVAAHAGWEHDGATWREIGVDSAQV